MGGQSCDAEEKVVMGGSALFPLPITQNPGTRLVSPWRLVLKNIQENERTVNLEFFLRSENTSLKLTFNGKLITGE